RGRPRCRRRIHPRPRHGLPAWRSNARHGGNIPVPDHLPDSLRHLPPGYVQRNRRSRPRLRAYDRRRGWRPAWRRRRSQAEGGAVAAASGVGGPRDRRPACLCALCWPATGIPAGGGGMRLLLPILLGLLAPAADAQREGPQLPAIVAGLAEETVEVKVNYSGARVVLFATGPAEDNEGSGIAVALIGPPQPQEVVRLTAEGEERFQFVSAPSVFAIAAEPQVTGAVAPEVM